MDMSTVNTATTASVSEEWINFEVDGDQEEMMQNDDAGAMDAGGGNDAFRQMMERLEVMKEKPLFSEDEVEEAEEEDDLFDDEDYDLEELVRQQKQKDEENRKKGIFDDDDYYDYYSEEEKEERQKSKQIKTSTPQTEPLPFEGGENVMQDYLTNIKSKSAPHRFKSKFDDFEEDDGSELLSANNRKLRKNDSIKIISTPNGKVGIVYKVEPKQPGDKDDKAKKLTDSGTALVQTDVQNKITPVITADGKVALLYRGASDNSETFRNKYEPITNKDILTQLIDNNNNSATTGSSSVPSSSNSNSGSSSSSSSSTANNSIKNITNNIYNSNTYDSSYDNSFNRNINNVILEPDRVESDSIGRAEAPVVPETSTGQSSVAEATTASSSVTAATTITAPTVTPFAEGKLLEQEQERQENSLLINRPLSEVLGIRKNQYLDTSIKIPNVETSTHKMRISNNNNLLSSVLPNITGNATANGDRDDRLFSNYVSRNHRNHANVEYDDRPHDRGGYSVNGFSRSRFYINRRTTPALPPRVIKEESEEELINVDDNGLPEVINLAIIPAFEHEIDEKYIRPNMDADGNYYHRRHRHQYNMAPGHPAVHCAMQAVVACAVLATFFGIVGAYFKSRIVDHIRVLYW